MHSPEKSDGAAEFRAAIRNAGLRCTASRLAVLELLGRAESPLSHAELADDLMPLGFDKATVFRNLIDLTDVNLLLDRLDPALFGLPVFPDAAKKRLRQVSRAVREATGTSMNDATLLRGFLRIADERMAEAIRRISIREGYDCSNDHLIACGGANDC